MDILFETERLIVRKFKAEDAKQLYENHMDEEVRKWFPNECYADLEEAQDAICFYADCVDHDKLPFVLGVELKETGELIGDAGISEVDGRPGETEIGYCIGKKYRGREQKHRQWPEKRIRESGAGQDQRLRRIRK